MSPLCKARTCSADSKTRCLSKPEDSGADYLATDEDVHAIGADSQRACIQIVNVLTVINSEV